MSQFDSDIDTNDSNIEFMANPQIEQQISEGIYKLNEFQHNLKRKGYKKIMEIFLTNHQEKSQQYLQKAQELFKDRKFFQSGQYAHLAYISSKKEGQTKFQRALIILTQIKIRHFKLTQAQDFIKQLYSIKNAVYPKRILLLKAKFLRFSGNTRKYIQCLEQLEKQCIENQSDQLVQKYETMVFYAQSLLQMNRYEQAQIKLQRWLPVLVKQKIQNHELLAKMYYILALIEKKKGNLYNEFCHLYCASAAVLNKKEHNDLFLKIQCEKIRNLINRKLIKNAVSQIQRVIKYFPQTLNQKYDQSSQLQQLVKQIDMKLTVSSCSQSNNKANGFMLRRIQTLLKAKQIKYPNLPRNSIFCI